MIQTNINIWLNQTYLYILSNIYNFFVNNNYYYIIWTPTIFIVGLTLIKLIIGNNLYVNINSNSTGFKMTDYSYSSNTNNFSDILSNYEFFDWNNPIFLHNLIMVSEFNIYWKIINNCDIIYFYSETQKKIIFCQQTFYNLDYLSDRLFNPIWSNEEFTLNDFFNHYTIIINPGSISEFKN